MYRKHWFQKLLLHTQKIDLFYLYINIFLKQIHLDCLLYSYALPSTKDKMINVIISRSERKASGEEEAAHCPADRRVPNQGERAVRVVRILGLCW